MGEKHQWNSTHIPPPAVGGDEEEQALLIVCLLASCPSPTTSFSLVSISTIQSKKGSLLAAKRSHSSLSLSSLFYLLSLPTRTQYTREMLGEKRR